MSNITAPCVICGDTRHAKIICNKCGSAVCADDGMFAGGNKCASKLAAERGFMGVKRRCPRCGEFAGWSRRS